MNKDQVKRLVELANVLDKKGFYKIADEIDKIVEGQEKRFSISSEDLVALLLNSHELYGGYEELAGWLEEDLKDGEWVASGEISLDPKVVEKAIAVYIAGKGGLESNNEFVELILKDGLKKVGREKVLEIAKMLIAESFSADKFEDIDPEETVGTGFEEGFQALIEDFPKYGL